MRRILTKVLILVVLGGSGLGAQATEMMREGPRTIRVAATAAVDRAPDRAWVLAAVVTEAETAAATTAANAEAMESVYESIRAIGLADDAVETRGFNVHPIYRQPRPQTDEPTIVGYRAQNEIAVRVDGTDRVGAVIDALVAAGINQVQNVTFGLRDTESARLEAIGLATAKARREAEALASAAGETLGPVLHLSTAAGSGGPGPVPMPMYRAEAAMATTPVRPGDLSISATVEAVYRIGR